MARKFCLTVTLVLALSTSVNTRAQDTTPPPPPKPLAPTADAGQAPTGQTPGRPDVIDDAPTKAAPRPAKSDVADNKYLKPSDTPHPILWQPQSDITSLDLYYGQGGEKHLPKAPFTFEGEDMNGTNPKFDARDANDKKWRVKVGEEARPEVVSSRLLWAVGYSVEDDYVLPAAHIAGLTMKRSSASMQGENIAFARFSRKLSGEKKLGHWRWADNPFLGTQEFDGLRVMMAVINNWDLKDDNNDVYTSDDGTQIYAAHDIGASFGTNGRSFTRGRSKGNLASFRGSKFITRNDGKTVDFGTPAFPSAHMIETFGMDIPDAAARHSMEKIGKNIPIEHARWMGSLLAQLSHKQIVDAFRASDFPADEQAAYIQIVESRIAELKKL